MRTRVSVVGVGALAAGAGLALGMFAAFAGGQAGPTGPAGPSPAGSGLVAGVATGLPPPTPSALATSAPSPTVALPPSPSPAGRPSPNPGPSLVPAPLTGRLVSPAIAARHPIAVMVDDHRAARPQSGFSAASVVWQAPAEGGIARYMLVFQDTIPGDVGPVRSARSYYIAWAAELRAMYVHSGGSPQSLATLRAQGDGQLVYNADEFAWGGSFRRVAFNGAPHNLYTTGSQLRALAATRGAADRRITSPWVFGADAPTAARPVGGRIEVVYLANTVRYDYDRVSNTYLRSVTGERAQIDRSTRDRVAPKNVVVMLVRFGPLDDGSDKKRLEAHVLGSGPAWVATNGVTVKGTWRKSSLIGPTRFFDAAGRPIRLSVGQTFIQVLPIGSKVTFAAGKPPPIDPLPAGLDPR
ncbi:MAG TPA: DUF3048 domain-containing protein [Patescibacteria group bacterium]|nr:DUF3048 domain-containing protein [Patescibacteria group bacterium]